MAKGTAMLASVGLEGTVFVDIDEASWRVYHCFLSSAILPEGFCPQEVADKWKALNKLHEV